MNKLTYLLALSLFLVSQLNAQDLQIIPEYSKAGFYEVPNSGREVYDFNVGWRFHKGAVDNAEMRDFNDNSWQVVNTPDGLELVSTQASGSNNYQGEAWYRKKFTTPESIEDKRVTIYFEAIMGNCKIWLNGELLGSHSGGYLPFSIDFTDKIVKGAENVIAVWTDNSDDPTYPPGKTQKQLDFSYFGGIYRDVWLVATNKVYISNPNEVDKVAGGGLFIHYEELSEKSVKVVIQTDVVNDFPIFQDLKVHYILKDKKEHIVAESIVNENIKPFNFKQLTHIVRLKKPLLWSPKAPNLYSLEVRLQSKNGSPLDGVKQKIGIRKIEFKGKDGFYLNNKPYPGKLIGANRHQDFAYVGNALPNSGQWRDAMILKEAGSEIVRAAHYPADPAFMNACDELGLFFIVATPGWQFWNGKDASFEAGVYQDIRNMVRRDRNHPSVILWEPILNETHYPDNFAKKVHNLVHEEYPFQGAYTACDAQARGQEYFDVVYSHPYKGDFYKNPIENTVENQHKLRLDYTDEKRSIFTREWGDSVDDWNSHNSPSRAARNWGENPMLVQSNHYAEPAFVFTSWESLFNTPDQHFGGALWHAFDHQRGYHPDPFYGGITDVFRQPKYSFQLFKSQRSPEESEPMIYIAHEMTPFSSPDVTVFTNCDEVRLVLYEKDTLLIKQDRVKQKMPSPIVVFKDVYDFADIKSLHRNNNKDKASILAEGLIDGKVVVRTKKMPATRTASIQLNLANKSIPLVANGSDFVTVIASIVDANGNVKRLNNDIVKFEIEGEGSIIGNEKIIANPIKTEWGTAPVLIKSTTIPGSITIKAHIFKEGINTPSSGEITFSSIPSGIPLLFTEQPVGVDESASVREVSQQENQESTQKLESKIMALEKELNEYKLKEVEKQQQDFEGDKKKN